MRKLILGAILAASVATPVLAQDYNGQRYDDRGGYSGVQGYDRDDIQDRYQGGYDGRDQAYDDRGYDDRDDRRGYGDDRRGYGNDRGEWRGQGSRRVSYSWLTGRQLPGQLGNRSWIVHPDRIGLPYAPRSTHWIAIRDSALLVRNYDRVVLRVVPLRG